MQLKNKQLVIETTNICDAHCVICPREQFKQPSRMMDMELFKKIIDDASQYDLESIDTCGFGECFLDKYFFQRCAYIREKLPKANIFISTTAYHMTNDKWDLVLKYVDTLKLSIYGATPETYEAFHRGKVKYDQTMSNIDGFLRYSQDKKRPYIIGLFVATDLNRHEQDDWINKWEPKLDEVFVWKPHNWVQNRGYRHINFIDQCSCGRPTDGPAYIHADGTVSPCCWDIHKQVKLGDMNTQTLEEVYKGEPYRRLREAHRLADFHGYICEHCDQTNFNKDVLIYKSNPLREVGQITSTGKMIHASDADLPTADHRDSLLAGSAIGGL